MSAFQPQNSNPSDECLCVRSKSGDRSAAEELVLRYNRVVRVCARPYFLAGGDSEDLIQEGMLGLWNAIREYDPRREVSFRTYAETCIRNRLRSAIKAAARDKHSPLNNSVSFETPLFDGFAVHDICGREYRCLENPEDTLIGQEEVRERMNVLKGQLSGFEAKILGLYLEGLSYSEIAAEVKRSPKSVDNAVQRIRRKVAQHFSSGDVSES
ncbi:sigma-70 family RNA polymerase sigma factor [Pseudoflavonifractor sp. DSM 107456]|uniref:RNA polymerase sigma factor SigS n=2 Tax=Pseudoflavonifractor TaxID=1017280 RepID=A0ABR9R968_9FIRM|nr:MULTISPECIES: sigma-70 family RNA polymerase sigma factor [Eubacteriales]MBC5731162.1 sigma-70 family RNA polymerase sigma factor [Pseudoflavonifractor hominis]MBE5055239.1 sigma-70 family RNA polymerase sigma factor [Pseudoflavonifractor gallinarum]MBS5136226.1 sigma-70 family RNA polymerase sigma factor [Oscillospiraceae bacterium]MBT9684930.1 sigma-70 family RNA polymerase sigma factor [Pseudoflavonifractor sp. MCC625]